MTPTPTPVFPVPVLGGPVSSHLHPLLPSEMTSQVEPVRPRGHTQASAPSAPIFAAGMTCARFWYVCFVDAEGVETIFLYGT